MKPTRLVMPPLLLAALSLAPASADTTAITEAAGKPADQASQASRKADALPRLERLFARALDHDAELKRQRFELEATREEGPIARARLLPEVSASGGYLWQDSTNVQTDPDGFGLDQPASRPATFDEDYWRVELKQSLFSLERWRNLDVADAQISAAEATLAVAERDLALKVSEAYVQAFLASQRLGLLRSQQEALELQSRQAKRAYELGVGDRVDELEARSRLDQAIADAVEADNELDDALGELERLTGTRPAMRGLDVADLGGVVPAAEDYTEQRWIDQVNNNLDVLRAGQERRVSEADTQMRRSGFFPVANLTMSYSDRNSEDELRTSQDYTANLEVSAILYRGGATQASVRQGEKQIMAKAAATDDALNRATQKVRTRLRAMQGGIRRLEALSRAIRSSELFLDAAERGEQLGLRDLVDVLDARASLYDQRINYVDTLGRFALDRLALQSAVGPLTTEDLSQLMALLASMTAE